MIRHVLELETKFEPDVFIAGGGPAGVAAAVFASRLGASVYLAEATGSFGGAAVTMLIPAFMQFGNQNHFFAEGVGREVHTYLAENCPETFRKYCPNSIPVETLKLCYDRMIADSGAQFSFFTSVIDVRTRGEREKRIDYVVCAAKGSLFAVKAKVYIDCTGDGDLCALAGAAFKKGEDGTGEMMASTLCGIWEGMDWNRVQGKQSRRLPEAIEAGVFTQHDLHLPGIWRLSERTGGSNFGHQYNVDGTDAFSITSALQWARKQLPEYRRYYREYLEGYEKMELVISAPQLGIRETRRITGEYELCLQDFLDCAVFDDEIGRYCYNIDIHSGKNTAQGYEKFASEHSAYRYHRGESYGIPYRCLTVKDFDCLLTAGRCISADRYMQSSVRVMPGCYITGQAAGAAAALAAKAGADVRSVDAGLLREKLRELGAYVPERTEAEAERERYLAE